MKNELGIAANSFFHFSIEKAFCFRVFAEGDKAFYTIIIYSILTILPRWGTL